MTKKKSPPTKGAEGKKVKTTSTPRKTRGAKASPTHWTRVGSSGGIESALLGIIRTSKAAEPQTSRLLQAKLEARFKKPYSLDEVRDALTSLHANEKIETGVCYSIKTATRPVKPPSRGAAAVAGSPTTHVRLDVEDFVRVALKQLLGGFVTPRQVLEKVDELQPGFEQEDIDVALELLFRDGEIRKSEDGRSFCSHDCP